MSSNIIKNVLDQVEQTTVKHGNYQGHLITAAQVASIRQALAVQPQAQAEAAKLLADLLAAKDGDSATSG